MSDKTNINKVVWIAITLLIVVVFFYERIKINNRIKNAEFTIGEIIKIDESVKGSRYVIYRFLANGHEHEGSVNIGFCQKCKNQCCQSGKKVKVRYDKNDPLNSDLVPDL